MNKTILKTAGFTLIGVIAVFVITFGVFYFFAPCILGNVAKATGNHNLAVFYYEKHYNTFGTNNNLATLVYELDAEKDSVKSEKYSVTVINTFDDFYGSCSNDFPSKLACKEYFYNKAVISIYNNNKLDEALVKAKDFVLDGECGYARANPFRTLISVKGLTMEKSGLIKVKEKLEELKPQIPDTQLINEDISVLNTLINS